MESKRQRLSKQERIAGMIETVVAMAAEQKPEDITTIAIAKKMGLSQGALFRHFPNKAALLQSVMRWVADNLLQRVEKASKAASALEALEAVLMAHIRFVAAHPGVPRILFAELQRANTTPAKQVANTLMTSYIQHVGGIIQQGVDSGEIRETINVSSAAVMFMSLIQGLVMQTMLAGHMENIEPRARDVFQIYRQGIEV